MKIGIVTLPLLVNYGGVLQNFALQQVLKRLGHEPITIDYLPEFHIHRYLLSCAKTLFLFFIPGKRRPFLPLRLQRSLFLTPFVDKYISKTRTVRKYSSSLIDEYGFEGMISGSDQVWRPMYNMYLKDMFLHFVKQTDVRKIAYAASFGVDNWEYTEKQTRYYSRLAKRFDAISVREDSGIHLCQNYLHVDAVEVLDPTLLLDKKEYEKLCAEIPVCTDSFLASYVLDMTPEKDAFIHKLAMERGLSVKAFSADRKATLSIEQWISMFRDASYIVTDSFHGTVFSIIFNKPFISIGNKERGYSRFQSLLGKFNLENRLVSTEDFDKKISNEINWNEVNSQHQDWQKRSINFLKFAK